MHKTDFTKKKWITKEVAERYIRRFPQKQPYISPDIPNRLALKINCGKRIVHIDA